MRPPNVAERYEDNDLDTQAVIMAYSQIREVEDAESSAKRELS